MAKRPAKRTGRKKKVELGPVRRAADRKIKELKRLEQTPNVRRALRQMNKVKTAVSAMCGPNMIFPI